MFENVGHTWFVEWWFYGQLFFLIDILLTSVEFKIWRHFWQSPVWLKQFVSVLFLNSLFWKLDFVKNSENSRQKEKSVHNQIWLQGRGLTLTSI